MFRGQSQSNFLAASTLAFRAWLATMCVLLSFSTDLNAQDFLPPGYSVPSASVPKPSPYDHLSFEGLNLSGLHRALFSLQLDRSAVNWADRTLWVDVGYEQDWTPIGAYSLLLDGYEESPNRTVAFLTGTMVLFPGKFNPDAPVAMRSVNEPKYTISRRDDFLVVARDAERRWYFESLDGGTEWRLARLELPGHAEQFTVLEYDGPLVTAVVFPNGAKATIHYQGDLPRRIDTPFGESLHFKRGRNGYVEALELYRPNGSPRRAKQTPIETYTFQRDSEGRITAFTAPSGAEYVCEYTPKQYAEENKTRKSISLSTVRCPSDGLFKSRRDEIRIGQEWLIQSTSGARTTSPRSKKTTERSHQDYLIRMQKLGGRWHVTTLSYRKPEEQTTYQLDAKKTQLLQVDPDGKTHKSQLDELGRPTRVVAADGSTTNIEYNGFGQETRRVNARGREQVQQFDDDARLTQRVDYNGRAAVFSYDERGFPQETHLGESVYRFTFDDWGRMTRLQRPNDTIQTWSYDPQGRLIRATTTIAANESAEPTKSTIYEYREDRLARVLHRHRDQEDEEERFQYDRAGRLRAYVRRDGSRVNYQYDRKTGWLAGRFDTTDDDETWTYHAIGRIKTHRIRKQDSAPLTREYDELGNLVAEIIPGKGRVAVED